MALKELLLTRPLLPTRLETGLARVALLLLFLSLLGAHRVGADYHVSPRGNDQQTGTEAQPFATLNRAIEAARSGGGSKRIVVHGGEYFQVRVELNEKDSGLTIEGAAGEEHVLYGGRLLTGFQPDEPPLWSAPLPANADVEMTADIRMLWVNGRMAPLARFPAQGELEHVSEFKVAWRGTYGGGWQRPPTHEELTQLKVRPGDLGPRFDPASAEITVFHEWDESRVGVHGYDAATGLVTFRSEAGHPPGAFGRKNYVVWNTRDGITQPGQWHVDRRRNRVLYWPRPGEEVARIRAIVPTTTSVIHVRGAAEKPVTGLTLAGLSIAVANTPLRAGGFGAYAFNGAVTAEHLRDSRFVRLTVRNVAGQAIQLSAGSRCAIVDCDLAQAGAGGILCLGSSFLELSGNHIRHVGRIYPSGIGLTCTGGTNRIAGNYIHDAPYVGLTADGYAARIESNRLERVMLELHDGAGIYMGGTNHLIRGNVCREIGRSPTDRRHAYYLDELVRHSRIEGNLAVQCPSPLHNHIASDNEIVNNVFLHQGDIRLAFYRCTDHILDRNLVVADGKIEVFRPEAVRLWTNNILFSRAGIVQGYPVEQYAPGTPTPLQTAGVLVNSDPQVAGVALDRATWPEASPAAQLGIRPLDLAAAGQAARRDSREGREALAARILRDPAFREVHGMAQALLKTGLNAGSGYSEVWIRDLNTFIEIALEVNPPRALREALLTFLKFQGPRGDIVDGYVPRARASVGYRYRESDLAKELVAHKNTVETDQESSLVQAVARYVRATGDATILSEEVAGASVRDRLGQALEYVLTERFEPRYGLVWGATTADWGDVQPESPWGVELDDRSHKAIDIYDNAMLAIAIREYMPLLGTNAAPRAQWQARLDTLRANIRQHLWDAPRHKFKPHVYLDGSPFPADFDENAIFYFGGTATAIEAGLLTREEIAHSLAEMRARVKAAGAGSIGLTLYPPYPAGFFKNPQMSQPYSYQNGGDWCWFGGRMIQALVQEGFVEDAYRELTPMLERVRRHGFHEWWSRDNQPRGSGQFRGSAGVLGRAIERLQEWARDNGAE